MKVIIEPNDVLLFRELRYFEAGTDHVARSMLPLPQTVAGAIRSKILAEQKFSQEAKDYVGYGKEEPKNLVIDGVFLWDREELFATPMDIVKFNDRKCRLIKPMRIDEFGVEFFYPPAEPRGGFLKLNEIVRYLEGNLNIENVKIVNVLKERRVGISLKDTKTTEEHMLYTVEFLRIPALSVWTNDLKFMPKRGLLKLGGEGRFANYRIEDGNPFEIFEKRWERIRNEISKKFKLYVATPLLIENSGKYTWNIKNELEFAGIKVERIIPLVGKPVKVSGWDLARNSPKGVRYAVPAGSVYFVEAEELNLNKPYLKLGKLTKLGYGLCFVGVWHD